MNAWYNRKVIYYYFYWMMMLFVTKKISGATATTSALFVMLHVRVDNTPFPRYCIINETCTHNKSWSQSFFRCRTKKFSIGSRLVAA